MIKYLLGITLLLLSFNSYAISSAQARTVFYDVYKVYYYKFNKIRAKFIIKNKYNNAGVWKCGARTICIETGKDFLRKFDKHQWAAIVGHELGHYHYGDLIPSARDTHKQELRADYLGVKLALWAGYRGCNIVRYWKSRSFPGDVALAKNSSHPAASTRVANLIKICGRI